MDYVSVCFPCQWVSCPQCNVKGVKVEQGIYDTRSFRMYTCETTLCATTQFDQAQHVLCDIYREDTSQMSIDEVDNIFHAVMLLLASRSLVKGDDDELRPYMTTLRLIARHIFECHNKKYIHMPVVDTVMCGVV